MDRQMTQILNTQSPQSVLSSSCARFCSNCSPNQQGELLMPSCSEVSNGEQRSVKVLTWLSYSFKVHYLETVDALLLYSLLLFDM